MTDSPIVLLLTKILPIFIYPVGLALLFALTSFASLLLGWTRVALHALSTAIVILWVCATPSFAEWALSTLEIQYPARAIVDTPNADVAILLGGAIALPVPPRTTIDLTDSSDRILHTARLYRSGKIKRVFVTGGNIPWLPGRTSEAEVIRSLLVEWGVSESAIEIAGASRNTYENAIETRNLLDRFPIRVALLVTSAAHMPRAMAVFKKARLPVIASPTDIEVVKGGHWTPLRLLPDASALAMTTRAMKEWIGLWAYRIRGYA